MVKKCKCNLWKLRYQNDMVKSRRFKKWEWICFHLQQVEEIKSWKPIFIQKISRAKIAHYSILLIRKNNEKVIFEPLIQNSQLFGIDGSKRRVEA